MSGTPDPNVVLLKVITAIAAVTPCNSAVSDGGVYKCRGGISCDIDSTASGRAAPAAMTGWILFLGVGGSAGIGACDGSIPDNTVLYSRAGSDTAVYTAACGPSAVVPIRMACGIFIGRLLPVKGLYDIPTAVCDCDAVQHGT